MKFMVPKVDPLAPKLVYYLNKCYKMLSSKHLHILFYFFRPNVKDIYVLYIFLVFYILINLTHLQMSYNDYHHQIKKHIPNRKHTVLFFHTVHIPLSLNIFTILGPLYF